MIGGRGLPTNLSAVQTGAEGIQVRKLEAPVDQLLSELENPKSTNVEAAQKAIVEQVELGDRETLIGQKRSLDPPGARSAAPKCGGRRSGPWAAAPPSTKRACWSRRSTIPSYGVVIEANNALCWFSRRPNGFGRPADPLAALPENASDRQKRRRPRRGGPASGPTGAHGSRTSGPTPNATCRSTFPDRPSAVHPRPQPVRETHHVPIPCRSCLCLVPACSSPPALADRDESAAPNGTNPKAR